MDYISQSKYLGFMLNTNAQDDEDMLRQKRTLYIRLNKLLRTIHYCSTDVKLELFKSYCTSFCAMYVNFGINNFEATIRKSTFGFIQRLAKSTNSLIVTIKKSWIVRIDI